jgi:hypothetical protein
MPRRSHKPPSDPSQAAKSILEQATGAADCVKPNENDPAEVFALGRRAV